MNNNTPKNRYEITFLDFILSIVQNMRVLIFWPILIGILTYAISCIIPQSFQASVTLRGTPQMASMFVTPIVIDSSIHELKLQTERHTIDEVRANIRKRIESEFNPKDNLVSVSLRAETSEQAKNLLESLLKSFFKQSAPKGEELERLKFRAINTESRLKDASIAAKQMQERIAQDNSKAMTDAALGYANIVAAISDLEKKLVDLDKEIRGIDESSIMQPVVVDNLKAGAQRVKFGIIAALLSFGLSFFLVFIRLIISRAYLDPEAKDNLFKIKKAFKIKI